MVNPHLQQSFNPEGVQPPSGPVADLIPITPNDGNDLSAGIRCIYVGTAGDVSMLMFNGQTRTVALSVGWHPIVPRRIRATGTTASNIFGGV